MKRIKFLTIVSAVLLTSTQSMYVVAGGTESAVNSGAPTRAHVSAVKQECAQQKRVGQKRMVQVNVQGAKNISFSQNMATYAHKIYGALKNNAKALAMVGVATTAAVAWQLDNKKQDELGVEADIDTKITDTQHTGTDRRDVKKSATNVGISNKSGSSKREDQHKKGQITHMQGSVNADGEDSADKQDGSKRTQSQSNNHHNSQEDWHRLNTLLSNYDGDDQKIKDTVVSENIDINARNSLFGNITMLHQVMSGSHNQDVHKKIKLLLELNADVHASDNRDRTPLYHAVLFSSEKAHEYAPLLINASANVNEEDMHGNTVLGIARRNIFPNQQLIQLLAEAEDEVAQKDSENQILFFEAVRKQGDDLAAVKEAFARPDVKINAHNIMDKSRVGDTALHYAVLANNTQVVGFLLENKADIYARNPFGSTVFDFLTLKGFDVFMWEGCDLLARKGSEILVNEKLGELLSAQMSKDKKDHEQLRQLFIVEYDGDNQKIKDAVQSLSIDVDARNNSDQDNTILHTILCGSRNQDRLKKIELLLELKADVNACNRNKRTPLHIYAGNTEIVDLLIKNKADVNAVDENGATPLHEAVGLVGLGASFSQSYITDMVKTLLAAKAKALVGDCDGHVPLRWAIKANNQEVITLLQEAEKQELKAVPVDEQNNDHDEDEIGKQ